VLHDSVQLPITFFFTSETHLHYLGIFKAVNLKLFVSLILKYGSVHAMMAYREGRGVEV
jgi:hypothetical protein